MAEWISVEDRMPIEDDGTLGFYLKGVIASDGIRSFYRVYAKAKVRNKTVFRWLYPWETISDEKITHWMPLPEPPKMEGDNQ